MCAATLRDWLDNLRPGSLLVLVEAHHAAPSSGSKYAIDSRITRAIRDIAPRFEHRLFLSATPHNGHSDSFSALLNILDPQRFQPGLKVLKSNLVEAMVRRLKEDIREIAGVFPKLAATSEAVDERWYWAAQLLLDLHFYGDETKNWLGYFRLAEVWRGDALHGEDEDAAVGWSKHVDLFKQTANEINSLGKVPDDLSSVLAEMAMAAPGIVAMRCLQRVL